jgi:SAM-dependent methyltransferase
MVVTNHKIVNRTKTFFFITLPPCKIATRLNEQTSKKIRGNGMIATSYDRVAQTYAEKIFDELKDKPLDRELLNRFAERVRPLGPACDMGCGPGQVARYLHEQGLSVTGVDISPGMVVVARELNPGIEFRQGDMLSLDIANETFGGVAAFYSIIHIPHEQVVTALRELRRILQSGGSLLLAFHIGQETVHLSKWWGHDVSADFHFFISGEMEEWLKTAEFADIETVERDPYPDVEHPSCRAYLFARKP